jgi:hypothetical protein
VRVGQIYTVTANGGHFHKQMTVVDCSRGLITLIEGGNKQIITRTSLENSSVSLY